MIGNYNESGVFHVCSECVPVCSRTWNVEKQYVPGVFLWVLRHRTGFAGKQGVEGTFLLHRNSFLEIKSNHGRVAPACDPGPERSRSHDKAYISSPTRISFPPDSDRYEIRVGLPRGPFSVLVACSCPLPPHPLSSQGSPAHPIKILEPPAPPLLEGRWRRFRIFNNNIISDPGAGPDDW